MDTMDMDTMDVGLAALVGDDGTAALAAIGAVTVGTSRLVIAGR